MGRHAATPQRDVKAPLSLAVAALVVIIGGGLIATKTGALTGFGLGSRGGASGTSAAKGCQDKPAFVVAAAPEVAPEVRAAADRALAAGTCAVFTIRPIESAAGVGQLVGAKSPDAWIPDSSTWLDALPATTAAAWTNEGSITHSPVVIATPPRVAATVTTAATSWASVINGSTPFTMANPDNDTASRLAYYASRPGQTGPMTLAVGGRLIFMSRLTKPTVSDLLDSYRGNPGTSTPFPASEQQVAAFQTAHPDSTLRTVIPAAGTMALDYPWLSPVGQDVVRQKAAATLRAELKSAASAEAFAQAGFRRPDDSGGPAIAGTATAAFTPIALIAADKRLEAVQQWDVLRTDLRMLAVLDVSGSMLDPSPTPGLSRWGVLQGAAVKALSILPDGSQVGGWVFSTAKGSPTQDWKPLSPIEPLNAKDGAITHRQNLANLVTAAGRNISGDTGLYDTTLAAFRSVSSTWDPNYVNSVVLMTDGLNDDTTGGIDLNTLLTTLKKEFNKDRPVRIITIGMGEADPKVLGQIAAATGGTSYIAKTPSDIERVFVQALLARPLPVT